MNKAKLLREINRMQACMGHSRVNALESTWTVFYEEEDGSAKGFVILYEYKRLPYEPDYNTGRVAEIGIFTFPKYRHQGVCHRLVEEAIDYAKANGIDIVADCTKYGYPVLKSLGFADSTERRVWYKTT